MGGGSIAVVRPDTKGAKLDAALKWIDFFYMEKLVNKAGAIRDAKILVANKQPVGVPSFPIFNKKQFDLANTWIKPYVNVPRGQMAPFLTGIFKQKPLPGAGGLDAERLPRARPGRPGRLHGQERRTSPTCSPQANDVAQNAIKDGK